MSIATTQLFSRLRTWALVAGLTALLITIGALIGGTFLCVFVILAASVNVVGYFLSDRIALRVAHAQPIPESSAPELHAAALELATRAGIPAPRLFAMPGDQPNAFATGRDPAHAAIAVTEGLVTTMAPEQVRAVLAHEIGHIANHDILVSSIAATIAGAITAAANVLQLSFLFGDSEDENPLGLVGSLAALILAPIAGALLQLGVSRQREYLADATAARLLGSGEPLADALETIQAMDAPALAIHPATAPMYIVSPLARESATQLFSTHPPLPERISRLRAYTAAAPARPPTRVASHA